MAEKNGRRKETWGSSALSPERVGTPCPPSPESSPLDYLVRSAFLHGGWGSWANVSYARRRQFRRWRTRVLPTMAVFIETMSCCGFISKHYLNSFRVVIIHQLLAKMWV